MTDIKYTSKKANKNEILNHLLLCNSQFIPELSSRVNIEEYSTKIQNNATTFEAWDKDQLIGLIAIYFNDEIKNSFITNVSVLKTHGYLGIASKLIDACIKFAKRCGFFEIKLEVNKDNLNAINFYKKHNFIEIDKVHETLTMKLDIKK